MLVTMINRIYDRAYLAATSVLYALMSYMFFVSPFGVKQEFPIKLVVPLNGYVWGGLFLFACAICLIGVGSTVGMWQKLALYVSALVAIGMTATFMYQIYLGQISALIPALVWGFIATTHIIMTKYHDPQLIRAIEKDVEQLKKDMAELQRNI